MTRLVVLFELFLTNLLLFDSLTVFLGPMA